MIMEAGLFSGSEPFGGEQKFVSKMSFYRLIDNISGVSKL